MEYEQAARRARRCRRRELLPCRQLVPVSHVRNLGVRDVPTRTPTDIWSAFTPPGARQRIRRLLALPRQPASTTQPAGSASGTPSSPARSASLRPSSAPPCYAPDQTTTAYGQLFARDVHPALESLAQSRKSKGDNHGTFPRAPPRTVQVQRSGTLVPTMCPPWNKKDTGLPMMRGNRIKENPVQKRRLGDLNSGWDHSQTALAVRRHRPD
jgi:hypothetical protein